MDIAVTTTTTTTRRGEMHIVATDVTDAQRIANAYLADMEDESRRDQVHSHKPSAWTHAYDINGGIRAPQDPRLQGETHQVFTVTVVMTVES